MKKIRSSLPNIILPRLLFFKTHFPHLFISILLAFKLPGFYGVNGSLSRTRSFAYGRSSEPEEALLPTLERSGSTRNLEASHVNNQCDDFFENSYKKKYPKWVIQTEEDARRAIKRIKDDSKEEDSIFSEQGSDAKAQAIKKYQNVILKMYQLIKKKKLGLFIWQTEEHRVKTFYAMQDVLGKAESLDSEHSIEATAELLITCIHAYKNIYSSCKSNVMKLLTAAAYKEAALRLHIEHLPEDVDSFNPLNFNIETQVYTKESRPVVMEDTETYAERLQRKKHPNRVAIHVI